METSGLPTDTSLQPSGLPGAIDKNHLPHVVILMCTYNGERFLRQQLNSFCEQTHKNWSLIVSDDGSTDSTLKILSEYAELLNPRQLHIIYGPKQGYAANFLHITQSADSFAEFYAWADQDDIWLPGKIEAALVALGKNYDNSPALYCSSTKLISESGDPIGHSKKHTRTPSFLNALVQSISGGNTMVFNRASLHLLNQVNTKLDVVSHDWLAYQLISGAGGAIHYDSVPRVLYRQHSKNIIGHKKNFLNKANHLAKIYSGLHTEWNNRNIYTLNRMRHRLSDENRNILDIFETARNESIIKRVLHLSKLGIYRQSLIGTLALYLAIIFKKI